MTGVSPRSAIVREFGNDFMHGMPRGQTIRMVSILYDGVDIWSEYEPSGEQHLAPTDIIEELRRTPKTISQYISSIVLSPFDNPDDLVWSELLGKKVESLATSYCPGQRIVIYSRPESREDIKTRLIDHLTLQHEAGHIIDCHTGIATSRRFSGSAEWSEAMSFDSQIQRDRSDLPRYFISYYAEDMQSNKEDFADAVAYYSDAEWNDGFLEKYYPNRYKLLQRLIG